MLIKFLNHHLTSLVSFSKRSVAFRSAFDLGNQMKLLNKKKQFQQVLQLFDQYKENNIQTPTSMIITQALKACAQIGDLQRGSTIHHLISSCVQNDSYVLASLIHLYMQCGDVSRAQSLFDTSSNKSLSMYGAMMKGYVKNNQANKAIDLFREIKNPNEIIITILFNACAQLGTSEALSLVNKVSSHIPKSFHTDPHLSSSLIDALMECGDVARAQTLFDASANKSVQMYGAMMKGYVKNNQANKAIDLFREIKNLNEVIIIILFSACAQLGTSEALDLVNKVSSLIPKSFYSNPRLSTSLIDALMKCGDVARAQTLFDASANKSLQMYGAMMKGYIKNSQANKAIDLFYEIKNPNEVIIIILFNACAKLATTEALYLVNKVSSLIPKSFYLNSRLSTSLIDALIKCGDSSSAETLFSKMKRCVITYGSLMSGFNKQKNPEKTLKLFDQMKKIDDIEPNLVIYLCVIKALSQMGDYSLCHSIIENIPDSVLIDNQIHSALIDMWGKVGEIHLARKIFDNSSQPDSYEYTAMINSYGLNGMGNEAVQLFHQMPSQFINDANHVCVLNACSHSGLVDQARSIFANISVKTDMIYTTMIDCLSRASMFEEIQKLIDEYEHDHSPSLPMYMALLSGARNENNSHLAQQVFDRMNKLFPQSISSLTSATILLSNVYASSGELDKASDIRNQLNKSGAKKIVGVSRVVYKGEVFIFRAHDQSHPRISEINIECEKISKQLAKHGHQYDSSWITRPLDQDETVESALCGHSERLAIAFSFVVDPNASRIQITKNLRVCGDCHRATKLIAAIRQCDIIVRDANRIHHFDKNGQCSCNDYF